MRPRQWAAAAVAMALLGGGALLPGPAHAQEAAGDGPLWYLDAMKISAIHESGITGDGVTVAVLDGGVNLDVATLQDARIDVRQIDECPDPLAATAFDELNHGTSSTSLIVGNGTSDSGAGPIGIAPGARILYYGALQSECTADAFPAALADAVAQGADIVTMSGGRARLVDELAQGAVDGITAALKAGVIVVASLPNSDSTWENELEKVNGVMNVAAVDAAAQPAKDDDGSSMAYENVDIVAPGVDVAGVGWDETWGMSAWSGTSAATPLVAGVLALAAQKWPDATSSQLLQSVIRNTGPTEHELEWSNTYGHGIINATRVVGEDPSQYPDENPLFTDGQVPTYDEVFSAAEPSSPPVQEPQEGMPWGILVAVGGLVAVVVVVVVVVAVRKRNGARHGV